MFGLNWRKRAIEAEKQLERAEALIKRRAVLMSIHRDGRKIIFTFAKNGDIHRVSTIGTWSDDIDEWNDRLLK